MAHAAILELGQSAADELTWVRDHHVRPYMRERAAALIQIAAGHSIRQVARGGLYRPRHHDTVGQWLSRYRQGGLDGLLIRPGRGRKPAFSPSPCKQQRG
jgi:transposase